MNVRGAGSYLRLDRGRGAKERLDVRRDRGSRRLGPHAGCRRDVRAGRRRGLYACVGFAILALPIVLLGLPGRVATTD